MQRQIQHVLVTLYHHTSYSEIVIIIFASILLIHRKKSPYFTSSGNNIQTEVTVALSCTEKEIFSGTNRDITNIWDMESAKGIIKSMQLTLF